MKQQVNLSQSQQLSLTPQLRQSLHLLQLSALELEAEITLAIESNPLLDWMEGGELATSDARDDDRDGIVGYDSSAQRKREFAADMGIQAFSLRMAAEGAVAAYEHAVGESWKPFDRPVDNPGQTLDRKAAEAQMDALG